MRPALLAVVVLAGCASSSSSGGGSGGSGGGAGPACDTTHPCAEDSVCVAGACTPRFDTYDVDDAGPHLTFLSAAFDSAQKRVGVAYFVQVDAFGATYGEDGGLSGSKAADGGNTPNYELRYVEWKNGTATVPEVVRVVQRLDGVSVAFQPSGEPAVAYLGGGSDMSVYWLQSDAVIAYRNAGTWTEQTVAVNGNAAACTVPQATVLDVGFLIGLSPALVFDGAKAVLAVRDAHNGGFGMQDFAASYVKVAEGTPGAYTLTCQTPSNTAKVGYGNHLAMVMGKDGQPALVHDGAGKDVFFARKQANGTWSNETAPKLIAPQTVTGPSLAYDPTEGFGIAVHDRQDGKLFYAHDDDGLGSWSTATTVIGSGSSGWYPSLAMDPVHHEPAIAYYFCAPAAGKAEGTCSAFDDELRVVQRGGTVWQDTLVDKAGGFLPKLGFFGEKRVIAYRVPATRKLRIAVER